MKEKKEKKEVKKKVLPVAKFQAGNVSATIWKRTAKSKKGQEFEAFNTEIVKNYTDESEEWHKTSNFNKEDLVKVFIVLNKSMKYLYLKGFSEDKDDEDEDEDEDENEDDE